MTPRRAALALAVVAVAAAGCGSSSSGTGTSPPPTPPPTRTPTATPTAPVTVTASASATKTVTPTPTPTPHPVGLCATSQLTLSLGQSQGAAGNFYTPLIVTNSGAKCTLFGYPGVSYINSAGAQVGTSAVEQGGPKKLVTVKHGATASALLHQPNPLAFPASACHKAKTAGIRFYPPGNRASLTVASANQVCTTKQGESSITTMQPGSNPQL